MSYWALNLFGRLPLSDSWAGGAAESDVKVHDSHRAPFCVDCHKVNEV